MNIPAELLFSRMSSDSLVVIDDIQRQLSDFVVETGHIQQDENDGREFQGWKEVEDKGLTSVGCVGAGDVNDAVDNGHDDVEGQSDEDTKLMTENRPQRRSLETTHMPRKMVVKENRMENAERKHEEGEEAMDLFVHVETDGADEGHAE